MQIYKIYSYYKYLFYTLYGTKKGSRSYPLNVISRCFSFSLCDSGKRISGAHLIKNFEG